MRKAAPPPYQNLVKRSGNAARTLTTLAVLAASLAAAMSYAGNATWRLSPTSGDWNQTANWMPRTVPNGAADIATFDFSNSTDVSVSANTIVNGIVYNAGASQFTVTVNPPRTLSVSGSGIMNNSGIIQNFVAGADTNGSHGIISFSNSATAGTLTVFTNNGSIGGSTDGGHTEFHETSSARSGTFISNPASPNGFLGGQTEFHESSTASNGVFIANGGDFNGGMTQFFDSSNAGNGSFTANGGSVDGGSTFFWSAASADKATFTTNGTDTSTGDGGETIFHNSSTADHGIFVTNGGTATGADGGETDFVDFSTAADGTFTVEGTDVRGAKGGKLSFLADSTAGNATVIVNSGNGAGGYCVFGDDADGGTARLDVFGNGTVEIDVNVTPPVTIGSIEGDGIVLLENRLNVGSNNLSTVFSGGMRSLGPLTKIGTGTLTLTGASTYLRGTTISDGVLVVNNATGSATGTGAVAVDAGTLGGGGIIAGVTTVGTGSGGGAFLEPSINVNRPTTLTIQSLVTFKADGTYTYKLNTKRARADQVIANGVTIESGAQFDFTPVANKRLTAGTVFTAISNTSASPITGTFANLPDGSTFTVGRNKYQVSYSGGDGNDLTLTVVP